MSTEQQIDIVRKYLQQKICFGLKHAGNPLCRSCRLAHECAPLRRARLAYEERLLKAEAAGAEVDAEFEAMMENMSKAKFEEMIAQALNREAEYRFIRVGRPVADYEQKTPNHTVELQFSRRNDVAAGPARQEPKAVEGRTRKGRPRTAKEKSAQVLTMAERGMTRQAIAKELGISLASVYRILKENR